MKACCRGVDLETVAAVGIVSAIETSTLPPEFVQSRVNEEFSREDVLKRNPEFELWVFRIRI